jgi:DNA end-binding protein Ku
VVITDEDIATLPEERSREIEVMGSFGQTSMMLTTAAISSSPRESTKSYVLLAKTLMETERVAIAFRAAQQDAARRCGSGLQQAGRVMASDTAVADEIRVPISGVG